MDYVNLLNKEVIRPGNAQMSIVYSGCPDNVRQKGQNVKSMCFWRAKRFTFLSYSVSLTVTNYLRTSAP